MLVKQLIIILFCCVFSTGCMNKSDSQALGTLELDRIILQTKVAEEIITVFVSEGTMVKKGQILLQLDDSVQKEMVLIAKAEVKQAMARFIQVRNGARKEDINLAIAEVEAVTAKLIHAKQEVQKTTILVKKNAIKIDDLDASIANRDFLIANQKTAQEKLNKLKNGARYEEIAQAAASFEKSRANLIIAKNKLKDYTIRATRSGRLESLPKHCGERAQVGATIAVILADGNPYARVYLPESMRVKVFIGSKMVVNVDGIKRSYEGTVSSLAIDPAFTPYYAINKKERSRLVYLAEIKLTDATELPIGLPVQVMLP